MKQLAGVGLFLSDSADYGYPTEMERIDLPNGLEMTTSEWSEVELEVGGEGDIEDLWRACVPAWRAVAAA